MAALGAGIAGGGAVILIPEIPYRVESVADAIKRRSRGGNLSGGEQQMLAVARALIRDPKLLMLDEPFEGLAPVIVRDLSRVIRELVRAERTIVIVEQNVRAALQFAHRVYVLNNGHVVFHGTPQELMHDAELTSAYLGAAV